MVGSPDALMFHPNFTQLFNILQTTHILTYGALIFTRGPGLYMIEAIAEGRFSPKDAGL
ncbi:hypothetical protein BDR07DRAFT_1422546 [Suillus spraguei]|nr:hypothetical protein BDR07DRAFT_1422546 [Suillus spraguei]